MSLLGKITKAIVLAPVHIVQGVVEASIETMEIMTGTEKKSK